MNLTLNMLYFRQLQDIQMKMWKAIEYGSLKSRDLSGSLNIDGARNHGSKEHRKQIKTPSVAHEEFQVLRVCWSKLESQKLQEKVF